MFVSQASHSNTRTSSSDPPRAFEAAVRLHGFGKAAEELALTQGAVSQHILALEEQYGVQFFIRHANGTIPTERAQALALQVRQALRILERTIAEVRLRSTRRFDPRREIVC